MKLRKNILYINLKGGAAKTTNASLGASYLPDSLLIEIDKINRSDDSIDSKGFYKSIQIDFKNETSENFIKFEDLLIQEGIKVIDVGAVKLEVFHKAMTAACLYDLIDLLVIPSMDGADDFSVAMDYLENIKDVIPNTKILFSFNRFNEREYDTVEEQFDKFFLNKDVIYKSYGITLEDSYYVLKDSKAVKYARSKGLTLKSLVDMDIHGITKEQRDPSITPKKRLELTKQRTIILNAQSFYNDYVTAAISKIISKLEA